MRRARVRARFAAASSIVAGLALTAFVFFPEIHGLPGS
jgi:hypothetical protein